MTRQRAWIAAVGFGLCLLVPLVFPGAYLLSVLFQVALFAALGVAWNLVGGYAGQLSLGHAAFFGIGAYSLALFHTKLGIPSIVSIVLGMALAAVAALVIGRVSFRLRGPYFGLATIAFAEVLRFVAKNLPDVTGGDVGVQVPTLFPNDSARWFYWAAVALTALAFAVTAVISRSRFGYQLQAIREDEDTAKACGIDATRTKLLALVISAALTAIAGALRASQSFFLVPDQVLDIEWSVEIATVAMLGGAGTLSGPIIGAIVLELAREQFKNQFQEFHQAIYGLLLIVVVLYMPDGIVGSVTGWWRRRRAQ